VPIEKNLLTTITTNPSKEAWTAIAEHLWESFSKPIAAGFAESETVRRDGDLNELDNVLSGSAWELWADFESTVSKVSDSLVEFWNKHSDGRAILVLDGLSLREAPPILMEAERRGYKIHQAVCRGSELPAETTPFAKALGFSQRSSLDNNGAGKSHLLAGATTATSDLNWIDCAEMIGAQPNFFFWHHWPDERMHALSGPGATLHKLTKEAHQTLVSDEFWAFVDRLATGRRLVITGDHGYAACGSFHEVHDKEQANYLKATYKGGRFSSEVCDDSSDASPWIPPIDLELTTKHGTNRYALGRRKWKSASGYPTLQHGGLSLLEVFVPFIEIGK
jgi:hypothetical protein